jgi:outer membrane protein assembly factor BamB/predicted phosphohydrolase
MLYRRLSVLFVVLLAVVLVVFAQPAQSKVASLADAMSAPEVDNIAFSFAQFTDVHISRSNENNTIDLRRAVEDVNLQEHIAFVLVTGDIAETGDYASLMVAKRELDKLNCPYYIIPGNHDTKWSESGATDFKRIFGDNRQRLQFNGFLFLCINSGPIIKMGDGHISPQDIIWIERQLKNVGKRMPVFVVTHYPLKSGDVDNWWMLTDVVRRYNVQAFLGGHYHLNMVHSYDGIPGILCRSTLRAKEEVGGYTVYDMTDDSLFVSEKRIGQSQERWTALAIEKKMYVEGDQKAFPRADYSVNNQYKNVKDVWMQEMGYGIYGTPAVDEDNLYFGDDKGTFRCMSLKKGKVVWEYQTAERIASTPMISGDRVVFGSCDRNVYCLDKTTGSLLWKHRAKNAVMGSPLIVDGVVYIGASDGRFRALRLEDGELIWSFDELKDYQESRPVIADGKVIFGAWDSYLYALNIADGSLVWKWNNGNTRPHFSPAAVWPVVAEGKVFITAPDRYMTAVNVADGTTAWRTKEHKVRETIGLSEDNKIVFSRCMNDSVLAVAADDCRLLWKVDAKFGYDHNPSMLIERNGMIVFATKNGEINCLRSSDGELLWKHKIGNSIINTMVPISDTDWVLTTTDGVVARISAIIDHR